MLEVTWTAAAHSAGKLWIERACLSLKGAAWERAAQGNILQDARKPFIALITLSYVHQVINNWRCKFTHDYRSRPRSRQRRPASDLDQKCGNVVLCTGIRFRASSIPPAVW